MHQEKEKIKICLTEFLTRYTMLIKTEDQQLKKKKIRIKWQKQIELFLITDGKEIEVYDGKI